jgi:hypothetical protein
MPACSGYRFLLVADPGGNKGSDMSDGASGPVQLSDTTPVRLIQSTGNLYWKEQVNPGSPSEPGPFQVLMSYQGVTTTLSSIPAASRCIGLEMTRTTPDHITRGQGSSRWCGRSWVRTRVGEADGFTDRYSPSIT